MQVKSKINQLDPILGSLRFNTLAQWLDWQEKLHFTSIELGLERCMTVLKRMQLDNPDFAVISVAGTNGKGSSVCMLRNILQQAGYKTGSYTSPHLIRYNERICINGIEVEDDLLCNAFERIDRARGDVSLTYFEFGTLAAIDIFQRAGVEIAVLEVGLGGRLDAVNCLDADVALIAAIDLDHENWLGSDRESIGLEKAGIMRSGKPAVCSDQDPPQSVIKHAKSLDTRLSLAGHEYHFSEQGNAWSWNSTKSGFKNLPKPSIYNPQQINNAAGVLMALEEISDRFPVPEDAIRKGLLEFNLYGRFQVIPDKAQLILDVAHNPQSAKLLVGNLRSLPIKGKTHMIIGMLKDKNHQAVLGEFIKVVDNWHLVTLENPRGSGFGMLEEQLKLLGVTENISTYATVAEALETVRDRVSPQDRIVVTGSFLTVGAAITFLKEKIQP